MKLAKRFGALLVALCLMMTMIPAVSAANTTGAITLTIGSATMSVNGSSTTIDAQGSRATIYKSYTMLPIRGVVENMGGSADWNASTQQVTLKFNGTTVVLKLGSTTAYVNGVAKTMSVAPFTDNGRTYVWLRTVEFFPNVTVSWRSDTRQATVVYPMTGASTPGANNVAMTIKNGADLIFKAMQLAPSGTTNYGANILSQNLNWNGTQTVNVRVGKQQYDLMATDYYNNKFYYRNLDFSNVQNIAVLTLTGGDTYSLVVDGILASGADKKVNLNIQNSTGQQIVSMVYGPANSNVWSNELLTTYRFNNGTGINLNLDYASTSPYYDFRVTYANGQAYVFRSVNLASQWGTQLIRLNANGLVTYNNSTSGIVGGDTEITFRNRSGETVYELKMATTNTSSAFRNADNLISRTKNGSNDDFDFDISVRKWYIRAYDNDGDVIASDTITFSSTSLKSATITLDKDGDFTVSGSKTSSSSSGDAEVVLINNTGKRIYSIFAVDPDDLDEADWKKDKNAWDYDDFEYDYEDLGSISAGDYDTIDVDLYGSKDNEFTLVLFYSNDDDDFAVEDISFNKNIDDYAVLEVTSLSSSGITVGYNGDDYNLDSDELFMEVVNETDRKLTAIKASKDSGDSWDDVWTTSIDKNSSDIKIIDYSKWGDDGDCDLKFVFESGSDIDETNVDIAKGYYYTRITIESDNDIVIEDE